MRRKIKILLVLEEYQEYTDMQSLLMKVGWDVKAVKRDILVKEEVFTFRPDLIIASGKGKLIDGFKLASQLERKNGSPKLALYLDNQQVLEKSHGELGLDEVIPKPFQPLVVLEMVCRLTGADVDTIIEKYKKLFPAAVVEEEDQVVSGGSTQGAETHFISGKRPETRNDRDWINDSSRSKKYSQLASLVKDEELQTWKSTPVSDTIQALHEKFANEYQDHDRQRQDFVDALFKD